MLKFSERFEKWSQPTLRWPRSSLTVELTAWSVYDLLRLLRTRKLFFCTDAHATRRTENPQAWIRLQLCRLGLLWEENLEEAEVVDCRAASDQERNHCKEGEFRGEAAHHVREVLVIAEDKNCLPRRRCRIARFTEGEPGNRGAVAELCFPKKDITNI